MIIGTLLIVLSWTVFASFGLQLWACILLTILGALFILFGLLFVVYFFNLDMKLMALLEKPLSKIYDKRERNRRI
jgi:hypothetical protein